MAGTETSLQKKASEAILQRIHQYLDVRHNQVIRINPRIEPIWKDVVWQQLTTLKTCLTGEKAYGPVRYHVAELLLSDHREKIRDLFSSKSQNCLLGEIVEEKETEGHRTSGSMEIHDMRTHFRAIDKSLETVVTLIQTYIWWDLADAVDHARFDKKIGILRAIEANGLTDEIAAYYGQLMESGSNPSQEEVINYELRMLDYCLNKFSSRRKETRGYQIIVAREKAPNENEDKLIEAIASQSSILKQIEQGGELDEGIKKQFAQVLGVQESDVTAEKAKAFLNKSIPKNKKSLKLALTSGGSGEPYDYKLRQAEEMQRRFDEVRQGRDIIEPEPDSQTNA